MPVALVIDRRSRATSAVAEVTPEPAHLGGVPENRANAIATGWLHPLMPKGGERSRASKASLAQPPRTGRRP